MEKYELPLVIFTVLSQMSVGMTLLLSWRTLRGEVQGNRLHWLITGLITGLPPSPRYCIWRTRNTLIMR